MGDGFESSEHFAPLFNFHALHDKPSLSCTMNKHVLCVHKAHVNRACQEWTEVHSNGLEINAPESQEVHRYFAFSLLSPAVPVSALTICRVEFTLA